MRVAAIDQGTTSTRLLLADIAGDLRIAHVARHASRYPQPGWVEHDPMELLGNVAACVAAAGAVDAVGIDNQGESCLAWDAATGAPLRPSSSGKTIARRMSSNASAPTAQRGRRWQARACRWTRISPRLSWPGSCRRCPTRARLKSDFYFLMSLRRSAVLDWRRWLWGPPCRRRPRVANVAAAECESRRLALPFRRCHTPRARMALGVGAEAMRTMWPLRWNSLCGLGLA